MRPVLLGAAHIDRIGYASCEAAHTSAPGRVVQGFGGVAYNVAGGLAALGAVPILVSRAGSDADGEALVTDLTARGVDASSILVDAARTTATYHAIINRDGALLGAIADMAIYDALTIAQLAPMRLMIESADLVFVDANLPEETLRWIGDLERQGQLVANSVSQAKATRLVPIMACLDVMFTNRTEGAVMSGSPGQEDVLETARALCDLGARAAIVSNGAREIGICQSGSVAASIPALPANPVDETGAGDALVAGTLFGLLKGQVLSDAVHAGLAAARMCVETRGAALPKSRIGEIETALNLNTP